MHKTLRVTYIDIRDLEPSRLRERQTARTELLPSTFEPFFTLLHLEQWINVLEHAQHDLRDASTILRIPSVTTRGLGSKEKATRIKKRQRIKPLPSR